MVEVKYVPVISRKETAKVSVSDIIMIERDKRKLHIVTDQKEYQIYERIENVAPLLDEGFYSCLKGFYINLSRVKSMADQQIIFDNGMIYSLGRDNFIRAKQRYALFLKQMAK